jgi:hypothetical protein
MARRLLGDEFLLEERREVTREIPPHRLVVAAQHRHSLLVLVRCRQLERRVAGEEQLVQGRQREALLLRGEGRGTLRSEVSGDGLAGVHEAALREEGADERVQVPSGSLHSRPLPLRSSSRKGANSGRVIRAIAEALLLWRLLGVERVEATEGGGQGSWNSVLSAEGEGETGLGADLVQQQPVAGAVQEVQSIEKILPQVFVGCLVGVEERVRDTAERGEELLLELFDGGSGAGAGRGGQGQGGALSGEAGDDRRERSVGFVGRVGLRVDGEVQGIHEVSLLAETAHQIQICGQTDTLAPRPEEEAALDLQVAVLQVPQGEVGFERDPLGVRGARAEGGGRGRLTLLMDNESLAGGEAPEGADGSRETSRRDTSRGG